MATATEPRASEPPAVESRRRPPAGNELWWWLFMRLSGILLLFLAVGHVLIMHVLDTGVQRVDYDFVVSRWTGAGAAFWRTWDWMMLSLALLHGINGVRTIVQDYVGRPGWALTWNWAFAIVGFTLFVLGTIIVFTFDPSQFAG